MPARTYVTRQCQTATKRRVVCCGFLGLAFLAIAGFGPLPKVQAAEKTFPDHRVHAAPARIQPKHAGRWLVAALASSVSAGPQASTLPAPEAGQGDFVNLRGNTRPEANAANDRGRVADSLTLQHLLLQLQRSPAQEQALQQFIKDIHNPTSPLFHHWITAAEFGQTYGVPSADVASVTDWLESQGFNVNLVYPNQMTIDFTGTAGQIRQAFRTEIHNLMVNGQAHIANMSDPQIPAELGQTVAGIVSLNDFRPHRLLRPRANYTTAGGEYLVVPADLATIYNFNPAFAAGYSGQGQTIVLIEDTNVYSTSDWTTFRSVLGLSGYTLGSLAQVHPASSPTNNCTNPGANGDDDEATLDVEWASAGAPSAAIELASCSDTETNFGGFIALQNLLNASNTPPAIVSISYGESESLLGASFNALINTLYAQAVTEGVSLFVSSGDEGAASSDADEPYAANGITVSGFTSTPYNVSVGGTDFADTYQGSNGTYWSSTNNAANYGSALSYVPEIPWNDSCASVLIGDYLTVSPPYGADGLCNNSSYTDLITTVSGSGGPSGCATGAPDIGGVVGGTCTGYAKPSWQSLVGNPSDGVRDIPDVSLFASNGAWGHYYVVCFTDTSNGGKSCSGAPSTWAGYGGTLVSSPIMAAIQALANQASGTRWGNPNPIYYALAAVEYGSGGSTSCNSNLGNTVASNCIFYDVTQIPLINAGTGTGGDNDVPCLGVNCYVPSGDYGVLSAAPQTLTSVLVTALGSGYTSAPSCTLSGGGGSGATCVAFTTGVVNSIALTKGGSGYTAAPTCALSGGGGSGATCVASISGSGAVNAVDLTSFGNGYTSAPTCKLSAPGGTGTTATCSATEASGITVNLTAFGSGYTTMPQCTLSGGGGTGGVCAALAVNTSDSYQPAYGATTGWDFTTGIGTVNATNLVASFTSAVSLSASGLTFQPQALGTTSGAQSATVTNKGTGNLAMGTVTVSGTNANDFSKSFDTCTGATVAPGNTCTVSVTFTPSAGGSRSASLNFTDFAPTTPQTVSLSGTGQASLVITASDGSMTYGGTPPTITPSYSGFENGDTSASLTTQPTCSTTATSHSPAGSYPSTCSGAADSNYTIGYVGGTVTDSAAPLSITASSGTMTYGGTPPTVTPIYSGFVNGNTPASLTTAPTCTTTASSTTPAGTDTGADTCAGAVDPNYTISYVPGNVAVGTASLTITASNGTMAYGGAPPTVAPLYTYGAVVNSSTPPSGMTTPPTCTTTATSSTPAGTDTGADTCAGAVDPNYSFTYVAGNVTVNAASLTITASSGTMTYGGTPPTVAPLYTYGAVVNSSTPPSGMTTLPTCTTSASSSTPAGTDTGADTCTGAVDPDYTISYAPGNATVNKATPVITWATPAAITYGTALSSTQLDATASVAGTFVYSPAAGTTPAAGTDTLSATFTPNDATDYNTATASVTLAVADFTFGASSGSSTTATVAPGSSATYTLSVGSEGGFNQSVTFTCAGAPSEATCTVSPSPAAAGTKVTVTVTTTAPSLSAPRSRPLPPAPPLSTGLRNLLLLSLVLAAMACAFSRRKQIGTRRWKGAFLPLAAGMLLALALAGCGGGGGSVTPPPNGGTPAGTYPLTVTGSTGSGSSALSHSVTLTLTVS